MTWSATDPFGVYSLANDPVLDRLDALYNSFRSFNPEIPFEVIPFDNRTSRLETYCKSRKIGLVSSYLKECDEIGSRVSAGQEKGNKIYRKFAAFWGRFEVFAFVDADTLILGDISDLPALYLKTNLDVLFYTESSPDRNYTFRALKDLSEFANAGGSEGFNAGFFLTRRDLFSVQFLQQLSRAGARLRRLLTKGHEQAFLNYAIVVACATAGILRAIEPRYATPWRCEEEIVAEQERFYYARDPNKRPLRILHWGGPLWGKGPNAPLIHKFSSLLSSESDPR